MVFPNLGNVYLWQDEGQTAAIALTIKDNGVPVSYVGVNYLDQNLPPVIYNPVGQKQPPWRWHQWTQFYLTAASFAMFGKSTFAALLPFAVLGVASVIICYFLALTMLHSRKKPLQQLFCCPFQSRSLSWSGSADITPRIFFFRIFPAELSLFYPRLAHRCSMALSVGSSAFTHII